VRGKDALKGPVSTGGDHTAGARGCAGRTITAARARRASARSIRLGDSDRRRARPRCRRGLRRWRPGCPTHAFPELAQQFGVPWRLDVRSAEFITQRVGAAVRKQPPAAVAVTRRPVAVAVDGVFVLTRSEGWKEARCAMIYESRRQAGPRKPATHCTRSIWEGWLIERRSWSELAKVRRRGW